MKTKNLLLSAFTLVGLSSLAQAAPTRLNEQFRGLGASSGMEFSTDGCVTTYIYLGANQNTTHGTGSAPETSDMGYVSYYSFNYCTNESSGGSGEGKVAIGGNASKLTVAGTFNVYDYSTNSSKTAKMSLTFTGSNTNISRGVSSYHFATPYTSGHQRTNGSWSDATVSGTVTVDGANLFGTTPTYSYGSVYTSNSGSMTFFNR